MADDDKIVDLKLVSREKEVSDDVVKVLEDTLRRAKEGNISGVMVCGILRDGGSFSAFSDTNEYSRMVGAMTICLYRRLVTADTREDEIEGDDE